MRTIGFIFLILACSWHVFAQKTVETSFGRVIGKRVPGKNGDLYSFKNIPYAKPPLGDLRLKMSEMTDKWDRVINGTEYGPACLSYSVTTSAVKQKYVSEDCLQVNIFTSEKCLKSKCQVIIYYHGGGINLDSAVMFDDNFIFERYVENDIVFAIPAYRVGALGLLYFGSDDVVPHNLAIHDCHLALHYIHKEITYFGGNRDDINLMGHSAGAHISMVFGYSPLIDPKKELFKKIIVISPVPVYDQVELLIKNSYDLSQRIGCYVPNKTSDQDILECLKKKDNRELLEYQHEMELEGLFFWNFLKGQPFMYMNQSIRSFEKNPVPREMMMGTTVNEVGNLKQEKENPSIAGGFMDWENPYEVADHFNYLHDVVVENSHCYTFSAKKITEIVDTMPQMFTQAIFVSSATYSKSLVEAGGKVYLYQTNQHPGSTHVSDMQYFIGFHRETNHTSDMDIVDSFYSQMIVNFTKYGEPSPNWEPLDPERMNYYAIEINTTSGIGPKMDEGYREEYVNWWYINMTAYDREVTKQKQQNFNFSHSPMYPGPVLFPQPSPESFTPFDISSQWWFYVLIVVVALILFFIIYLIKRTRDETETPLLSSSNK